MGWPTLSPRAETHIDNASSGGEGPGLRPFLAHLPLLSLTLVAFVASSSCVTAWDGRRMESDIEALQAEMSEIKKTKDLLKSTVEKAEGEVGRLSKVMRDADEMLQRNNADFGVQIEEMKEEIQRVRGLSETVDYRLKRLEGSLGGAMPPPPGPTDPSVAPFPTPPQPQGDIFSLGQQKANIGQCDEARRLLRAFVQQSPTDGRAEDAQYTIGECYFKERQFEKSILEYQKILDRYPDGGRVDDAYMRIGDAFASLGACADSKAFYKELIKKFPSSALVAEAKRKLSSSKCR